MITAHEANELSKNESGRQIHEILIMIKDSAMNKQRSMVYFNEVLKGTKAALKELGYILTLDKETNTITITW